MQPDGTILSKAQIEISSPKMYYLGEKRAYYDQQTGKTYICWQRCIISIFMN